jgi:hypothetical protein
VCLPQVIKSFQNYRGVATTFYPTLVKGRNTGKSKQERSRTGGKETLKNRELSIGSNEPGWRTNSWHIINDFYVVPVWK